MFNGTFWTNKQRIRADSDLLVADLVAQTKLGGKTYINTTQWSVPVFRTDETMPKVPISIVKKGVVQKDLWLHKELQKGVFWHPKAKCAGPDKGDGHLCTIHEDGTTVGLFKYECIEGVHQANWGEIYNINTLKGIVPFGPDGQPYGARCTSLALPGGLILISEFQARKIGHKLALGIPNPSKFFVSPALRTDGNVSTNTGSIPYGQVFMLRPEYEPSANALPAIRDISIAMRDEGIIVVDRAGSVCLFAEDPTQYITTENPNPYGALFNNQPAWYISSKLPWSQLVAMEPV